MTGGNTGSGRHPYQQDRGGERTHGTLPSSQITPVDDSVLRA